MGPWTRFRSSLVYPIAATLVLVTVAPVALIGLLSASENREYLTIVERQHLVRQAVSLASEVSLFFSSHRTQLESTVRALERDRAFDLEFLGGLLQRMAGEPGRAFVYLEVRDLAGEGTFVQAEGIGRAAGLAITEAVLHANRRAVETGEVVDVIPELADIRSGVAVYSFLVQDHSGRARGTLAGVLDLEPLTARLVENAAGGLIISLVDGSGQVVSSSSPGLRGRSLAESPLVAAFLRTPARLNQRYLHPVDEQAGEVLGSVAQVPQLGWAVVAERPTALAFATIRSMQQRTLVATAVAALIALAIGFGTSRRLTTPIQKLAGASTEIAQGNLAVRADVHGRDEIASLAINFNNMAVSIEGLVRQLKAALRQNQELFLETIRTLATAIDAKDPYTRGHSERVSSYSMAMAKHLGMLPEEVFRIRIAAILHDVGKLGIRDSILNKPSGLTEDEFDTMRRHAEIGAQIMSPIKMLRDIIPGIRNHHETWDGTGYPDRLKGDEIPMVARIIGVADTFDAMTTTRPYQKAMTAEFVMAKMRQMAGNRFDPRVVDALHSAVQAGDITPPFPSEPPAVARAMEVS